MVRPLPGEEDARGQVPRGTVTFLFTDIEGSTKLLERLRAKYAELLAEHSEILRSAFVQWNGHEVDTQGDAFFVSFSRASDAIACAMATQRALASHDWPDGVAVRVRMALHTGEPMISDAKYVGMDVHVAARIASAGHGGQVLLSQSTQSLVRDDLPPGATLRDLGPHQLKDIRLPQQIFQLDMAGLPTDFPALRTLASAPHIPPHNLPARATALVGRERELETIRELMLEPETRLVTLTGTGGAGKTRLALEAAVALLAGFRDGVFFVDLSPVADPALIASAIAQVLGLRETGADPALESVKRFLRSRQVLLVLDNFEHVLPGAAHVVDLIASCPSLRVLATSREPLHLQPERDVPVHPLAVPDLRRPQAAAVLGEWPSLALFVQRARMAQPDFMLNEQNARSVAEICVRLDGLPLAIELVAARIRVLTPAAILARLDPQLTFVRSGEKDFPRRHRTLEATIDWSYKLLSSKEQTLFRGLAVFAGGWTLEAAEAVSDVNELNVLDGIDALLDKSLLWRDTQPEAEPRFGMLETVRAFARHQLEAEGELETTCRRHAAHFLTVAERLDSELLGPRQTASLDVLERELDNVRAALEWSEDADRVTGLRLASALWLFWFLRGRLSEGRGRLEGFLATAEASRNARAKALFAAGFLAQSQGDYDAALAMHQESAAIYRELGDRAGIGLALFGLGRVAYEQGKPGAARELLDESLTIAREIKDETAIGLRVTSLANAALDASDLARARALFDEGLSRWRRLGGRQGVAYALSGLGDVLRAEGDVAAARPLYEEALAIQRGLGDRANIPITLRRLGFVTLEQGDIPAASAYLEEALILSEGLASRSGLATSLEAVAALAAKTRPSEAIRLAGAAAALRDARGAAAPASWRTEIAQRLAPALRAVSRGARLAGWAEGRSMTTENAVACATTTARAIASEAASRTDVTPLTPREREIVALVAQGLTSRQIAEELVVTERTVDTHLEHVRGKLGVRSRAQITAWAAASGILAQR